MLFQHNERWVVLGDLTNSTHFLYEVTHALKAGQLFEVTSRFNVLIEKMYRTVEHYKPETSALVNTMGDGFLVAGTAGHGNSEVRYEFPQVLAMCFDVKMKVDEDLIQGTMDIERKIEEYTGSPIKLPNLRLRLCVNFGHILTSVGFNRYIGDAINYAARVSPVAYFNDTDPIVVLTKKYFDHPRKVKRNSL